MMLLSAITPSWAQGVVALVLLVLVCIITITFAALFAQKVSRWSLWKLAPSTLAALIAAVIAATIEAQKAGGDRGTGNGEGRTGAETAGRDAPIAPPRSGAFEVTNLCFMGISVSSNDVALSLAWPTNLLFAGDIVDLFAATSLVGATWGWVAEHELATDMETNWTEIVDTFAVAGVSCPPTMFFSASVRIAPDDLCDTDGDTIPDAYEFHNGTNPYIPDYALAPKLTVGPSGMYADISSALDDSTSYSIIELAATNMHVVGYMGARMPQHPVMVCSPPGPPAVVRVTGLSAFLLDSSTTSHTLFRNLYVLLDATSGSQAGFWVGGNLPLYPIAASATFEDIYVRAPNPGVEYFGWLLYASAEEPVTLSRCTVNAAGSEWVYGVQDFGTAPLVLNRCSFVNFPPNGARTSCGVLLRSSSNAGGGAEVSVSRGLFDESFTNAVMFGRLEGGLSNVLSVADCLIPRELPSEYRPDFVSGVVVTNAALAWSGFPWPDSPSVALGMGSLSPIANGPTVDTDCDGLCDYEEIYMRSTDPYLADTDRDGVPDDVEVLDDGTDPTDPHSFLQHLYFSVTNTASLSHAAYVAWGYSDIGWETNGLVEFPLGAGTNSYVDASANGAVFIKAFCDLDDNGEFNAATDILFVRPIPQGAVATINFMFGDVDGDGVTDEQEREDGTDPYDDDNFLVNLFARFEGLFHTTNSLSVQILMDTNVMYGPVVLDATNRVWTFGPQSLVAVTGGHPKFVFWDDADFNGVCEVSEKQVSCTPSPFAHDMAFTNRLSYGTFDGDADGMLDWWELQHGLCPTNKADAVEDADGDTLLNVHEFLSGTDPHVQDGTNTLIYSLIHSIDDRLAGKSPTNAWEYYSDYKYHVTNGLELVVNTNCWLNGVTLPSAVERHPRGNGKYWAGLTPLVIGKQHLLNAAHCQWYTNDVYEFRRPNGEIVHRRTLAFQKLCPELTCDIAVGILDEPLPDDILPISFLPANYADFIGDGQGIPAVRIDQESRAVVQEIQSLPYATSLHDFVSFQVSQDEQRSSFLRNAIYGDSAHSNFLVFENVPVFLFATHRGGAFGIANLAIHHKGKIENAVNKLCNEWNVTNLLHLQEFEFGER